MEASQANALLAAAKERKARANARALSGSGGLHPSTGQRPEKPRGVTLGGGVDVNAIYVVYCTYIAYICMHGIL